jgi:hypothetical protein
MPRRLLPALLLVLTVAVPSAAQAWTWGDTLTVIWKPLPNIPSFARPGDTLTVWASAPVSASAWGATLRLGALTYPLTPAGGGWQPRLGRWVLGFRVPGSLPEETYDLELVSDATATDVARHAVKVLPAYRSDFYFAQISDTHLTTHVFSNGSINTADTSSMADFDAVIDDLNLIHPEFVLHTGDLVNEGELEEYLGMYEMTRANEMLRQLRDPIFVVTGNHDIGGWKQTAPPDGTARKNWWRQFGWPFLLNPPAGDAHHSQDFSFDYGLFHGIGLEAYINNGPYDSYRTDIWGPQSFTAEQLAWLAADVAAVPAGHAKLAFYHYDFGGAAFSPQMSNPAALGLDGEIWGHNHGVAEGNRTAKPFNLGLQGVVDGRRTFRIFRVSNGVITPGPMHKSGGSSSIPIDSLTASWSAPNNGTRSLLTATINNRFGEAWNHSRLVFAMVDHDSTFLATGGTIFQTVKQGGIASVYVDCVLAAAGLTAVTVRADQPEVAGVGDGGTTGLALAAPSPNPLRGDAEATIRFTLATAARARLSVYDLTGRRVATPFDGEAAAGAHEARWNGRDARGARVAAGVYVVRLETAGRTLTRRLTVLP